MTRLFQTAALCLLALASSTATAHEVRPGYLELTETGNGAFEVLWKVPLYRGAPLFIRPELPPNTEPASPIITRTAGDAETKTWTIRAEGGLRGQPIAVQNLESTLTDVLVRVQFQDGSSETLRLTPSQASAVIPETPSGGAVAWNYFELGVEHILLGIDHLLFVLALMLLVKGVVLLIETVTAFTIAHSITLAAATLSLVHVPSGSVEAIIALSIVFVAGEIVHSRTGHPGLSERYPWIVAFTFGLLHGFGFAGALSEVGLPQNAIPIALLFFNLGVEAGQLIFIAVILALLALLRRVPAPWPPWAYRVPAYGIGSIAMYWCLQRVVGIF